MGFTFKFLVRRLLRLPDGSDFPADELDDIWDHFDHGTQRAILRLYRSAPPRALEAAGAQLDRITCPALVVWGDADPYLPVSFAHDYTGALGGPADVEVVEGAGHWPWIGRPEVVDRVAALPGVSELWDKLQRAYDVGIQAAGQGVALPDPAAPC